MNIHNSNEINIGIDTSQTQLDIYVRPLGHYQSFENNTIGIQKAIDFIKPFKPSRVLIESTGRLELAFACAAYKATLPIVVCNQLK